MNATNLLRPIASKDEILATENHTLETFYPVLPTIDLQEVNAYDIKNDTGEFPRAWRIKGKKIIFTEVNLLWMRLYQMAYVRIGG